jgi:hypothetical protein
MKRIALAVAVLLAACGTETAQQSNEDVGGMNGVAALPVTASLVGTTAKVVLKTAQAVYTPVSVLVNAELEQFSNVSCTDQTAATDCAAFPGAVCHNLLCSTVSFRKNIFYAKNIAAAAGSTIPVPCDGGTYSIEVYGGNAGTAAGTFDLVEVHNGAEFQMPNPCPAPASMPSIQWTSWPTNTALLPTLVWPTIYAGFGAPWDTYSVNVSGLRYPWSPTWSLGYTGQNTTTNPTRIVGTTATLNSPATNTPLVFTATFFLDRSILVSGEVDTAWRLTLGNMSRTPVGAAGVPVP